MVAACFAVTATLGETFWSFGVFFKPLENEFGWSRAITSSGYTAFLVAFAISLIFGGRLADRYSPRPILLIASLLAGLGISLCSQIDNIAQLRIFLFIAGLGAGATWAVPTSTVQRWFYKRRRADLALGIVITGVGVGALIFAPLINYLILNQGWRYAYLLVGIIFFTVIAIASLVVKRGPADIPAVAPQREKATSNLFSIKSGAIGTLVTTRSFMGISFAIFSGVLAFQVVSVHMVPAAADVGISPTAAAAALGLIGGFSIPGRIISGLISDRIGWQKTLALSLIGTALSLSLLLFLQATWMLYCFAFFYGTAHGIRITAQVGIMGGFYGMTSLGEIIGTSTAIAHSAGAFAPYITGFIFDITGSYLIAFIIVMVLLFSGGFISTIIKQPATTLK